jgi:ElaB/YqjD/DUF883 family membrane-anchored ribosome-binding protein
LSGGSEFAAQDERRDSMDNVTRHDLVADLKVVLNDVEAMLQQAASAGSTQAQELRERAQAALRATQAQLRDFQDAATQGARSAARTTDDWVHANPWRAIGVAAGVGLVVGVLIGRR